MAQLLSSKPPTIIFCSADFNSQWLGRIFAFRKRVLVDQEGWRLRVVDGEERDEFDTRDAVHAGLLVGGEIAACMRLIRTDRPYLARSVFPQLATFRSYPDHAFCWELSRLAVAGSARSSSMMLYAYSLAFHFARAVGAVSLVAFAEVAKERLVRRIGITTHLLGPPTRIGDDTRGQPMVVVAGELPLRMQSGPRFMDLLSLFDEREIGDAFAVFGRLRLSA